jgi:hypothetical protein
MVVDDEMVAAEPAPRRPKHVSGTVIKGRKPAKVAS